MKKICILFLLTIAIFAQPYWTNEDFENFYDSYSEYKAQKGLRRSLYEPDFNVSYPFKFVQACDFVASWQLLDEDSSEFGGIIEAEDGELRDVIQTDNTSESVLIWSQLNDRFDLFYEDYIDRSWTYLMNFPAYHEEVSEYSSYYPFWNSGLGLITVIEYAEKTGDDSYLWYGDSCAQFLMDSSLSFHHEHYYYENLHPIVTAFGAGCLYNWAESVDDSLMKERSLYFANRVMSWLEEDPDSFLDNEAWAMSSGTIVWGLFESYFKEHPDEAAAWLDTYYSYLPEFAPPAERYDPYLWDNSWNIWYANGYRSIFKITSNADAYERYRSIVDYLIIQDTDDDGGITASAGHPVTEDMAWVTTYLVFMGIDGILDTLGAQDIGSIDIEIIDDIGYYVQGETLEIMFDIANCGMNDANGDFYSYFEDEENHRDITIPKGERQLFAEEYVLETGGINSFKAIAFADDDEYHQNDTFELSIEVVPMINLSGTITDYLGEPLEAQIYARQMVADSLILYDSTFTNPETGYYEMELPGVNYEFIIIPEYPAPIITLDSVFLSEDLSPYNIEIPQAHLLLVDDDGDTSYTDYEQYYTGALDSINVLYHIVERNDMEISADMAEDFQWQTLLWFTGLADENTLEESDINAIEEVLSAGGNIIISGQYISDELQSTSFLNETVGVTFNGNNRRAYLYTVEDDPITGEFEMVTTVGPGSANNSESHDQLTPETSDPFIIVLPSGDDAVAVHKEFSSGGKLIYFGLGLESLSKSPSFENPCERKKLLRNCFAWFDPEWHIDESSNEVLPEKSALKSWPNPFNSAMNIYAESSGTLQICDIQGNIVYQKNVDAKSLINWAPGSLPSGLYFVKLYSVSKIEVNKCLYMK
ncbi:MAG: T9SS type A sorting domain-containing protein [Candidatus Zixiibacteriota bacterium]